MTLNDQSPLGYCFLITVHVVKQFQPYNALHVFMLSRSVPSVTLEIIFSLRINVRTFYLSGYH
jgi:hypothetical protein